jgi:hypothetical protein
MFIGCGVESPTRDELAGIWASEDSASLDLHLDGTFKGNALPAEVFFIPSSNYEGKKFSGDGKWLIRKGQTHWEVYLDFINVSDPKYLSSHPVLICGSGLLETKPPWLNLFLWKEEEGGDRYEFKKK